jgi:hypothetical protein
LAELESKQRDLRQGRLAQIPLLECFLVLSHRLPVSRANAWPQLLLGLKREFHQLENSTRLLTCQIPDEDLLIVNRLEMRGYGEDQHR